MKRWWTILGALVLLIPISVAAKRLDDSASPRRRVVAEVEWVGANRISELSDDELNMMVAYVRGLEVILDTSDFLGKKARIFLGLPSHIRGLRGASGFRMEWQTNGLFSTGSVAPGNRQLIFEGTITAEKLTDIFDFTIHIDTREVTQGLNFDPIYEIEPF